MLLLDSRSRMIKGVSVFPDHADPLVYYYLPATPHLSTTQDPATGSEDPSFLLLGYAGTEEQGTGGFVNFDCNLGISETVIEQVAAEIRQAENLAELPRLAPVPLVGGTVSLQMLGTGTGEEPTPEKDGRPQFVLGIDHPTHPSLYGTNQASFSVQLDQAGFTVLDSCLDGAILPIAVIYSLEFLGLRPAYHVTLKIDWDRLQDHLDETFGADVMFFSTEISETVDELIEKRVIEFGADSFFEEEGNDALVARRDAAVGQVRQMITEAFFTPSIPPWTPAEKSDWEKALDAIGELGTKGAAIAAGGGGATSNASFSYKRTHYTRIDKKSLDVNFSERTTVKRTIHPQGHLAQVLSLIRDSGRPREDFVRFVNLDDPRFRRRRISVSYRPALAVDEIDAIDVRADYAGQVKNAIITAAETWRAEFDWLNVIQGGTPLKDVEVSYKVMLKNVDTTERPSILQGPTVQFREDDLLVLPEEDAFSIVPIAVRAENLPWEDYSSVNVELRYVDEANAIRQTDTIRLDREHQDGVWKMFVLDPQLRSFEVRRVFFGTDSRTHTEDWSTVDDEQVAVRDPFPPLEVTVVPPHVWTEIHRVFVDLRYEDEANNFRKEDSFTFQQGAEPAVFRVKLRDPGLRTVHFTVTFQMADGRTVTVPESMTSERRIAITPDMRARRVVTVRRPVDFVARKIEKVTVNLSFNDLVAGLSFSETIVFDAATETGTFEYQIVDENRDSYEYDARYVMANGMLLSQNPTVTNQTDLTLVTP